MRDQLPDQEKLSILHVDDSKISLKDFREFIDENSQEKFDLCSVQSPERGLRILEENDRIQLCVVDHQLLVKKGPGSDFKWDDVFIILSLPLQVFF